MADLSPGPEIAVEVTPTIPPVQSEQASGSSQLGPMIEASTKAGDPPRETLKKIAGKVLPPTVFGLMLIQLLSQLATEASQPNRAQSHH